VSDGLPSERPARVDPDARLRELRDRLQAGNPDLYRHQALYLQVLRQVLPDRVERACFHLATQLQPRRYAAIPLRDRRQLHRRLGSLVKRCTSFLTVEQLCSLATQMAKERRSQERRERQELMRRFASEAAQPAGATDASSLSGEPEELPEGSVRLAMALPLHGDPFSAPAGWTASRPVAPAISQAEDFSADGADGSDDEDRGGEAGGAKLPRHESDRSRFDPWSGGQLPRDPITLLDWLDGLEQALIRRLRNLSHAINVELLRHGLSGTLLPVGLLDAVLNGQIEPQPAPANLLRLQLPFASEAPDGALQALALLLRPADLELEEPRLRTCRRRLQQHRQEVRRMAHQYRRLQRWREAHESEQLWLQDLRASRIPPA
jgi:hypothetical protein